MRKKLRDLILFLLLGPMLPAGAACANKYMVENVTGTNGCYLFQTTPTCSTFISGISSGSLPSGSTFYIQNTLSPSTTSQTFNVAIASAASVSGSTVNVISSLLLNSSQGTAGQVITSNGPGLPPSYQAGASPLNSTNTWTGGNVYQSYSTLIGTVTVSSISFINNATGGIVGTKTNDSAAGGFVGQYLSSTTLSRQGYPTSAQFGDLVTLTLTPGDWDVNACIDTLANGGTLTNVQVGISQTSGNSSAGLVFGDNAASYNLAIATNDGGFCIAGYRQSVASNTSIFLKYNASYSVATPTAAGRLSARRIR